MTYDLEIDPPPFGVDGVEHFLFNMQRGYSQYFGSAMAVMLRSVGVPARMVTGYSVGDKIRDQDVYVVKDNHSHGWVEVFFFPVYGLDSILSPHRAGICLKLTSPSRW